MNLIPPLQRYVHYDWFVPKHASFQVVTRLENLNFHLTFYVQQFCLQKNLFIRLWGKKKIERRLIC